MIIVLVNGSLGTSVTVTGTGTFSLVRFRSAVGGARELLALFLVMTIGSKYRNRLLNFSYLDRKCFLGDLAWFECVASF